MISDAVPGLRLLRSYRLEWLRGDLVAGLVLAAYLLPAGLGDASLAGLPPEAGLYACLFAGLVFWLFCSSRHTAITVTSAISLLVGTSLGDLAGGDVARYARARRRPPRSSSPRSASWPGCCARGAS